MGKEQQDNNQSIRQVAGEYMTELYQDTLFDVFRFGLPAKATLEDHSTGPRIIVLLTDLAGKRLVDGSEFAAPKGEVLYLTNVFSPGFINHTEHRAEYLVVGLNKGELIVEPCDQECTHESLVTVLSQGQLKVCQASVAVKSMPLHVDVLHYQVNEESVKRHSAGEAININSGDWLIEIHVPNKDMN